MLHITMNEQEYTTFIQQLKTQFGIDLSLYKQERIKRRVDAFLIKNGYKSYIELLQVLTTKDMLESLIEHLTINVSGFFRNRSRWDVLETKLLPQLIAQNSGKLKIWSAACASGEEPYTLAIILSKLLPKHKYEILATDLDSQILKKAADGKYDGQSLQEVPPHMKSQYFEKQNQEYVIRKELKQNITFKKHDLLLHNYGQHFDLIVCRNVMIYFTEDAKHTMYQKFSHALRQGGLLFVGSTEQVLTPEKYGFRIADTFFYEKHDNKKG